MGYITINDITFSPTPSGNTLVNIYRKLCSAPELSSWTTVATNVSVPSNGVMNYIISGLVDSTCYKIRVEPVCGGDPIETSVGTGAVPIYYWVVNNTYPCPEEGPPTPISGYVASYTNDLTVGRWYQHIVSDGDLFQIASYYGTSDPGGGPYPIVSKWTELITPSCEIIID